MPDPSRLSGAGVDLSPRVYVTKAVAASPADATETIIATLTLDSDVVVNEGIIVLGWGAYTVGTNGVSCNLRIRRTNASGTIVAATGAVTRVAANLAQDTVHGFDTGVTTPGAVYVLTATLASATAASTFSAVQLTAIAV